MFLFSIFSGTMLLALAAGICLSVKRSGGKCPLDIIIVLSAAGLLIIGLGMIPYKENPRAQATAAMKEALQEMPGTEAPDFTGTAADGQEKSLYDYAGKGSYVLLDLWASWCGPCRRENPNVVAVYEKYKGKKLKNGKKFVVLNVSLDTDKGKWASAIEADHLSWDTHVSDLQGWNNAVAKQYGITSVPTNILIDDKGVVVAVNLRGEALDATLKKLKK